MNKKNDKGFTLLELLISIFILTTVIFLGYRVINKSTIDIKNQGKINQGQLTVNDMNEYLTKDLEQASSIALFLNSEKVADTLVEENENIEEKQNILSDKINDLENELNKLSIDNKFDYSYAIRFKDDESNSYSIIYNVSITRSNQYYKYSISREENNGIKISFINDSVLKEKELPFIIEGNSPYKVILGYTGRNNDFIRHEFTVTYRLNHNNTVLPEQETPPPVEDIIPPSNWGDYNAIGFWTADASKKNTDNLYTWISTHGEILGEAYADQESGKNDKFNIEGFARPENKGQTASYIGYNTIDKDKNWKGQVKDVYIGEKNIVKISIYVSPNTKLENFKIQKLQGNADIQIPETLNEGWHHCTITTNSQVSFEFKGELSIDKNEVSSGYAYVVYEREDNTGGSVNTPGTTDLDGDIVFEFTREDNDSPNQTKFTTIMQTKDENGEYIERLNNLNYNQDKTQLSNFRMHMNIQNNSWTEKENGKYKKNQIDDSDNCINMNLEGGQNPSIKNNQVCKDIRDVKEILIKCDENVKLKSYSQCTVEKISETEYKIKPDTDNSPNFTIYFDISNYDTNKIGETAKFKIAFTLIEG